jgi:hypothetical protein
VAPIVRKPAFRKFSWRSRQANQECFSERHVSLMTLTVISSNEQRVKQPTYAVVQVPRLSMLPAGNDEDFHSCSSWAMDTHTFDVLVLCIDQKNTGSLRELSLRSSSSPHVSPDYIAI